MADLDLTGAWYGRGTVSGRRCNRPYHKSLHGCIREGPTCLNERWFRGFVPSLLCGRESAFLCQTCKIFKRSYYGNFCMDSNQISRSSTDHQICIAYCPNVESKFKMADGCHMEKPKYHHVTVFDGCLVGLFACIKLIFGIWLTSGSGMPT